MELSMLTIEAFAHYMRGAVTLFFIFWCFKLYVYKRRNRMMKLLYYATLFLAFGFLKDAVFLFSDWKNSMLLNDVPLAIGSNKTYLSDYFNNSLNTTFYDYINRYFLKVKGMSPKSYYSSNEITN